jgi:small subunit ribosomal protein S17
MAEAKAKKATKAAAPATKTVAAEAAATKLHRRTMVGVVVSDKMNKTRVIRVERQVKQGMYGKYTTKANKFKAHDEENRAKTGDMVMIVESRPLSREKRWAVQKIIRAASNQVLVKG